MKTTTKVYTVKRVGIEGTQRGFAVMVETVEIRRPGQVAHYPDDGTAKGIDAAYELARAAAESIKRGRWVASRNGWSLAVNGRKLVATKS